MNSGGASSHAPPPHKTWKPGGSGSVSAPLPFSAGGDNAVTCKTTKTQQMAVDFNLFLPLFFRICFSLQIRRSFFGLCLHLLRFRCLAASRRNGRVWVAAGWSPIRLVAAAVGFCCRCPAAEGEAGLCAQKRRKGRPAGRG